MAHVIKVTGGTRSGKSLCHSCHRGIVMRGEAESDERVFCNSVPDAFSQITTKIVECNSYSDKNQPTLSDLYQTAWILETSKNKRSVGFTPWKDYRKAHPEEDGMPY